MAYRTLSYDCVRLCHIKKGRNNIMEIEITKDGIIFDGKTVNGEINVGKLKEILGEPRVHEFKPDPNFLEVLRHKYGDKISIISYTWDDLGIFCHTRDGENVDSIGFVLDHTRKNAPQTPKSDFSGVLKINGGNWFDTVKTGKDICNKHLKMAVGQFSVYAEYCPEKKDEPNKTEKDFTLVEVTLET